MIHNGNMAPLMAAPTQHVPDPEFWISVATVCGPGAP